MRTPYLQLLLPTLFFLVAAFGLDFIYPFSNPSTGGADGIKNLYTFAWYLDNNESFTNFEGMAHPYGEHIAYTDGHPFLAMLLKPIWQGLGLFGFAAPLLSILIHLSWLLTPIPLFLLLRHYGAKRTLAIAGAVGFTLLSPQILRDGGHYALAYTLAIPLSWWLTERWFARGMKWKDLALLAIVHFFWLGTHAYLGLIAIAFSSLLFILKAVKSKDRHGFMAALITGVFPVALFMIWLRLTDNHSCRLESPYGYLDFTTSFSSVLMPQSGPLSLITRTFGEVQPWEGWAYIGISAVLTFLIVIVRSVINRKKWSLDDTLRLPILAATILFIVACGFPFNVTDAIQAEDVPLLRQFRGIGRFVWPLYYVLTLASVVLLSKSLEKTELLIRRSLSLAFFLILTMEIGMHLNAHRDFLTQDPHPFGVITPDEFKDLAAAIETSNIDAILPIPYFHIGSEMYMRFPQESMEEAALVCSYHTRKPLLSAHLTRGSLNETRNLLSFISGQHSQLNSKLSPERIGVITTRENLSIYEEEFLSQCNSIWQGDEFELLLLEPNKTKPQFKTLIVDTTNYRPEILKTWTASSDKGPDYIPLSASHFGYTMLATFAPDSTWKDKNFIAHLQIAGPSDTCCANVTRLKAQFIVGTKKGDGGDWLSLATGKHAFEHPGNGAWSLAFNEFKLETLPDSILLFLKAEEGCFDDILLKQMQLYSLP